ncbi:Helix-turn-helix domain-containing protein [Glycomyces sambucus]|uniref:Helix-turn-helix domain-containing protein n=1 Tax=Glycomyces sambucus TaxID=380244 RepID=A0A1G9F1X5_9ACTN|nr:helix-turn-helix domain-containing protein [Glycomyces sambucus]SDK82437.1 Helix-turn-helix domain-containing protein [Glycomyces sambucus]
MDEPVQVATPAQYRALGHPVRHRLLLALGERPATLSGLAADLGISKGSAGHHLKILREAGLVDLDEARKVRGGTEQYFKRAFRKLHLDPGESTKAALAAVADEMLTAEDDPLLHLRSVRLSEAQARRLRDTLDALVQDLENEEDGARYGVLVGLYRPRRS